MLYLFWTIKKIIYKCFFKEIPLNKRVNVIIKCDNNLIVSLFLTFLDFLRMNLKFCLAIEIFTQDLQN